MYLRCNAVISRCEQGQPNERYPDPLWYMNFSDLSGSGDVQVTVPTRVVEASGVLNFVSGRGEDADDLLSASSDHQIVVLEMVLRFREAERGSYRLSVRSMRITPADVFDEQQREIAEILRRARAAMDKAKQDGK